MRVIEDVAALPETIGEVWGPTDWQTVDQDRVTSFADVTNDHQWIHVDAERAATDSPFGGTIAHGALTLSLCTAMVADLVRVRNAKSVINLGFDRVRFSGTVPTGSRLRGSAEVRDVRRIPGGYRVVARMTMSSDRSVRPVCVADQIFAVFPDEPAAA